MPGAALVSIRAFALATGIDRRVVQASIDDGDFPLEVIRGIGSFNYVRRSDAEKLLGGDLEELAEAHKAARASRRAAVEPAHA